MKRRDVDRTEVFERMPVGKAVMLQAMPAIISQMITLIYNLADTYFVGLLNSPAQTASVGICMPVFLLLTAISNLFGVGGASLLAQTLGKKDKEGAGKIASISFWCGMGAAILFSLLIYLIMTPVLRLVGATDDTLQLAINYLRWTVIVGGVPTTLNILLGNLVRAEGKSGVASMGMSMGGILNMILDPFFVLPQFLGMGAAGAGLATCLSNLAGTLFFIVYILKDRNTVLSLAPSALKSIRVYLGKILRIGAPSALQFLLTVVAASAMTKFTSSYSTEAVAAFGIQKKIDQLPLYFSIGMANGMLPLLAYNYGSGNHERRKATFRFGCTVAVAFALLTLILFEWKAPLLTRIFIEDPTTVNLAARFLRIQIVAQPLVAINYPMIIQFQAVGQVKEATICSILRKGVLDIPLLFLMDHFVPLYGLMWVQPIVDCIAMIVSLILYRAMNRRLNRE